MPHDVNRQTHLDMTHARNSASFNVPDVRDFLYGRSEWDRHAQVVQILLRDPIFSKSERDFMDRTRRYTRALSMTNRLQELADIHKWTSKEWDIALSLLDEPVPMALHAIAFEPVFMSQGSPSLIKKYGHLVRSKGILGCYLQTELGHGTNVSQLETTATFIPATQEFEIHSPTLTSSKWWIGALGKTSTHGVVQARLILPDGQDVGPHLFFIQLRSLDNHEAMPGIVLGDIGPKALAGYSATDNGFARFDHVRIPKEHMLAKFAHVTDEGKYAKPPHAKLSYGGMLYIRSRMVTSGGWLIAKAATVSIRYATVRRQGEKGADGLESQIVNYPSVYYRLLPILSRAYVFILLGRNLIRAFDHMSKQLASGDTSLLAELHAMTCGLKVLVTTSGIQDLEVARRSMGGHGFSAAAGLGRSYADFLPSATYEGDNFVLDQQVVRAALKSFESLSFRDSVPQPPSSYYLRLLSDSNLESLPILDEFSWLSAYVPILLLEWRAAVLVRDCAQHAPDLDASAHQRVSKAVTEAFVAAQVGDILKNMALVGASSQVVTNLYQLYFLTTVESGLADFLSFGLLRHSQKGEPSADTTRSLRMAIVRLCQELLPNAIGLTDAFGLSDWELDSALGVYDGKVYEALWERAQAEPLNKTSVPVAYEEFIKPILLRGQRLASRSSSKL